MSWNPWDSGSSASRSEILSGLKALTTSVEFVKIFNNQTKQSDAAK